MGTYQSDKRTSRFYGLKLNRANDSDIIEKLESTQNKQEYIKGLIRADMNKEEGKTMTIRMNLEDHEMRYGFPLKIGTEYVVIEYLDINTGATWYQLKKEISGVSGNADPSVKRFHGWRGTTNDTSKNACGVRRIENIVTYKNGNSKITLSEDIHPEWE